MPFTAEFFMILKHSYGFFMVKKLNYGFKTLEVVQNRLVVFKSVKITIRILYFDRNIML